MVGKLICLFFVLLTLADAKPVFWAKWKSTPVTENGVTKYTGTITVTRPNGQTVDVGVKFSSSNGVSFVQDGTGTDYWKSGSANSPYRSAAVDNDPTASSVVALLKATTIKVEFTQPLGNVYLSYISINGNTYSFDKDFEILSNGAGYWGTGTVVREVVGTKFQLRTTAGEPHGTIGLKGTFPTFSFDVLRDENWNGFTIGTYGLDTDVNPGSNTCVDVLRLIPNPTGSCCSIPSLYCVKLLNAIPQTPQTATTCTKQNEGSASFTISQPNQKVVFSSDPQGTKGATFDELGIFTVTAPSGTKKGTNYIAYQNDCQDTTLPSVTIPTTSTAGATDVSSLFNGEVGTFSLNLKVFNKYTPFGNTDVYVCTGSSLTSTTVKALADVATVDAMSSSTSQSASGLSTSMTVLVAVLSAVGTSVLIIGVTIFAGYSLVKKGTVGSGLSQQLQ